MKDILYLLNAAVYLILLVVIVASFLQLRRAKKFQEELVQSVVKDSKGSWYRVKVSRPNFFKRKMKLTGFEAGGVLVDEPEQIRVVALTKKRETIERVYPKTDLRLSWLGNPGIASSNMHWIALGEGQEQLMITGDTGFNALQSREATADLCRRIQPDFSLPENATKDFALEKNKASLGIVVLFFFLGLYALIDGVILNKNELLNFRLINLLMPALFVFAIPAYYIAVRAKVPSRESLALSIFLVMGLELASIPIAKRIDAALSDGAKSYDYILVSGTRLVAVNAGPPPLTFRKPPEYRAQFDQGSVHQFNLIHGPLGLWQLDHATLTPKVTAFYDQLDRDGQVNKKK